MTDIGRPFDCAWARITPQRFAMSRSTGRIRPSNHSIEEIVLQPTLQLLTALAGWQKLDTKSDFPQGQNAGVEGFTVGRFQPELDSFIRCASSIELGKYIRIQQEPAHSSIVCP